jgi:AraC-like DNA-binding protein
MPQLTPTTLSTVSVAFIEDWLTGLRRLCDEVQLASFLERSELSRSILSDQDSTPQNRVTLDQIVALYQIAAIETGDEMMGLWSRTIRPRALQHLLTTVREARSLSSALYRFSTFWNLLLDDYQFELIEDDQTTSLCLVPRQAEAPQRFGHMLILKLAHGLISWLARNEVPMQAVSFAFKRPEFSEDYAMIFPAPISFGAAQSSISFASTHLGPSAPRNAQDLTEFLRNAPHDWIFTKYREHTQSLRVREFIYRSEGLQAQLGDAAQALGMTPRTLMRRLDADGTSFQAIKDGLRRDLAILELRAGDKSIDDIAHMTGFSSSANFHRAFSKWTGVTPGTYRNKSA